MSYQSVFKRYEIKYLVTNEQKEMIMQEMQKYMYADKYGKSTICNIYFDTPDFLLIRRSLEHPLYKEKLRLRSYGVAKHDSRSVRHHPGRPHNLRRNAVVLPSMPHAVRNFWRIQCP